MGSPSFWEDNDAAQIVIEEVNQLKAWTVPYRDLKERFENVQSLLPEAEAAGEAELVVDLEKELAAIDFALGDLEVRRMLSGEMDNKNCYLEINSGAGGTEACDWALMLSRMYQRWGTKRGWTVDILDSVDGDVAGIKSLTLKLSGPFAYGYAKAEKGVHRLVRISPFDSNAKRHTSFASVNVTPEITDDIKIDVRPDQTARRHLPRIGCRRPARQQNRFCGPDHPPPDRNCRFLPGREEPDPEPRDVHEASAR